MRGRLLTVLFSCASLVCATGCKQSAPAEISHDSDVRAIQESEAQWNEDFASRNIGRLVKHYADNAVVMSPGEPVSTSSEAIRRSLEKLITDPEFSIHFEPAKVEVSTSGDLAYTLGSYTITTGDPQTKQPVHDHGSYVTTYRKQDDGKWKAVADIAASDVHAPAAGADSKPESAPKAK